eukprot:8336312-Alexandrium_andersonii.AAC.1
MRSAAWHSPSADAGAAWSPSSPAAAGAEAPHPSQGGARRHWRPWLPPSPSRAAGRQSWPWPWPRRGPSRGAHAARPPTAAV